MPIRAGSGGLKYPLVNQAQIQAQQAAAAASAGGSASASAYGANRRLAGLNRQLRYNALQAEMDRNFKAEQAFYDREHQMGGQLESQSFRAELQRREQLQQRELQGMSQDFRAHQAELDRDFRSGEAQKDRDFTADRDKTRFEQDKDKFERGVDAGIENGIRSGKLELPPASQQQLQKLEADRANAKNLTPDQQAEFERKYAEEKRRLLRTATPPGGVSAAGQGNSGLIHYNPKTGQYQDTPIEGVTTPYQKQPNGPPVPLPPDPNKVLDARIGQQKSRDEAKAAKDQAKAEADWIKERNERAKKMSDEEYADSSDKNAKRRPDSEFIEAAEEEMKALGIKRPGQAGQQQGAQAPQPGVPQAQQPPLPAGAPQGSRWTSDGKVALPDGTVIVPASPDSAPSSTQQQPVPQPPAPGPQAGTQQPFNWHQAAGLKQPPTQPVTIGNSGSLNVNTPEAQKRQQDFKISQFPAGSKYQRPDGSIWIRGTGSVDDDKRVQ